MFKQSAYMYVLLFNLCYIIHPYLPLTLESDREEKLKL